jgi:hypothetical protein
MKGSMKGTPTQEAEILTQILSLRNDPVGFVQYAYPWGEAGTPFESFKGPRDWHTDELEALKGFIRANEFAHENDLPLGIHKAAWSSGRGLGKTALFAMAAHFHQSTCLGGKTVAVANTEGQLRGIVFPEMGKWFTAAINGHWFKVEGMKISVEPWLADLVRDQKGINPDQWVVIGKTWTEENPDAYVGEHNAYGLLVLFDEAAGVHSSIWDKTEGFFTEKTPYRYWLAASQMRNRQSRFFEIFNDPRMGKGWRARTLSTRGAQGIDQALVEDQIRRYGEDSDFVRVEIMGLPPLTSEDQFIPWSNVRAAQNNELVRDWGEPLILGVDPAPRGKTAWRFRQGRNARDCCGAATHGAWLGYDNLDIAEAIIKLDQKYKPDAICIDFGMGTGVIDVLKRKRTYGRVHTVKFGAAPYDKATEWATHAIELWAKVRDWLPEAMIEPDDGERGSLSQQLTDRGWRWSGREDGKKILETKDDLQRRGVKSPDDADALACTFEVNPPRSDARKGGQGAVKIAEGMGGSPLFG